jgi:hypothetical protein
MDSTTYTSESGDCFENCAKGSFPDMKDFSGIATAELDVLDCLAPVAAWSTR